MPINSITQIKLKKFFKKANNPSSLKNRRDNTNNFLCMKEIEFIFKNPSPKKTPGPDDFMD